jgi:hypothetical protein
MDKLKCLALKPGYTKNRIAAELRVSISTYQRRPRYFGHSGTGFSEKGLKEAIDRLKPLFIDESPVENPPKIPLKCDFGNNIVSAT